MVDTASVKPSPQRGEEEINYFLIELMQWSPLTKLLRRVLSITSVRVDPQVIIPGTNKCSSGWTREYILGI